MIESERKNLWYRKSFVLLQWKGNTFQEKETQYCDTTF